MSMPSVPIARERLKNLLISDRMQCAPDAAERLRKELHCTVSKYMEIRPEDVTVDITRNDIHIKYTGENH
ncbi:MAG TPA: cell division topological specificity factor MinE [Candidatus Mediterraneibacter merdipullorum]|nr:cell division topological specificity factor MinE [Candidatus Mediterraneibacter merdipullorum]